MGIEEGTSGAVIGRYERNEITPSIEIANKIAKKILERVEAIAGLPDDEQSQIFKVIDALLRDNKAKKAYA